MSNVTRLPDSYAKSENSNNYKLLNLNEQAIADAKADAQALLDIIDLQKATGYTLDLYGSMVGQKRGALNDTQYRALILTRIGINISQGTYESIAASIQNIFNCDGSDIVLRDGEGDCEVEVEKIPLVAIVNAGFSSNQALEIIENLLPVCVTIKSDNVEYQGTFEFADTENVYAPNEGFGNATQNIGGYLGMLQGEDESGGLLPL